MVESISTIVLNTLFSVSFKLGVEGEVKAEAAVAVPPSKAKQFLASLRRPKRNIWNCSHPDVQQWI